MVTLHIYFDVSLGNQNRFLKLYWNHYVPIITKQLGFVKTSLLKSLEQASKFEIDIVFTSRQLRQEWADSPDHAAIWPLIEQNSQKIFWEEYSVLEL